MSLTLTYHNVLSFDTQRVIEVAFEQSLIYLSLHIKSREEVDRKGYRKSTEKGTEILAPM
jgi:hypothetical protein